ncbi:MAG: type II toxin-antitoxin system VapC family toxin [bacterium]|nr:type II toxin-antitoxin system VapC family toxin [bacterium]
MSALVLDAAALIAVERNDRAMLARLRIAMSEGLSVRTHAMIVAQGWRGMAGRQANLARLLDAIEVTAVDESRGRAAGELCGDAATSDPIDAALALEARPGDWILTGDPADMHHLVETLGTSVSVVPV